MERRGPLPEIDRQAFGPKVANPDGTHRVVLVCEHASPDMPDHFDGLGLTDDQRRSHIAWDPGALATAERLAALLDAPLVRSGASRLIYDCNRPPEAADAVPERSEATTIPGNRDLGPAERQARVDMFYRPFEDLLSDTLDARGRDPVLVTIHSFTPIYLGRRRTVEIGILHDRDARLADRLLAVAVADGYDVARNAPYGPEDGVTHTLRRHALPRGCLNVMIEIRNDLIATSENCAAMAATLAGWLRACLDPIPALGADGAVE